MYRRSDPRFRRTLNEISQTIESANESAQANIFTFSHNYLSPCFSSLGNCLQSCTSTCLPSGEDRVRRSRARSRARPELSFDFYDDWDDEETAGLLAWDNDDLDRLLPGSGGHGAAAAAAAGQTQPARQRAMSYGARRDKYGRRKSQDPDSDPTLIPSTSYFGFLGSFTSKITGGKPLRYKPSAADLQEHPGASRDLPPDTHDQGAYHKRNRSNTVGSTGTTDSLSSRGDIFPSEDEDDAIPLDDEFAMVLERRTTGSGLEEITPSGGKGRSGKRPSTGSRLSTRTMSSRSGRSSNRLSRAASGSSSKEVLADVEPKTVPSMKELKQEEDKLQEEEEADIARKRDAAQSLALRRGLSIGEHSPSSPVEEGKHLPTSPLADDQDTDQLQEQKPLPTSLGTDGRPNGDAVSRKTPDPPTEDSGFVPAQLPRFSNS